jgi:hypothetical protein
MRRAVALLFLLHVAAPVGAQLPPAVQQDARQAEADCRSAGGQWRAAGQGVARRLDRRVREALAGCLPMAGSRGGIHRANGADPPA